MAAELPAGGLCAGAKGSFVGFRATHGIRDTGFPNRVVSLKLGTFQVPLRCGKALEV